MHYFHIISAKGIETYPKKRTTNNTSIFIVAFIRENIEEKDN